MGFLTYLAVVLFGEKSILHRAKGPMRVQKERLRPTAVVVRSRPGRVLFSSLLGLRVRTLKEHSFSLTAPVTPSHEATPRAGSVRILQLQRRRGSVVDGAP